MKSFLLIITAGLVGFTGGLFVPNQTLNIHELADMFYQKTDISKPQIPVDVDPNLSNDVEAFAEENNPETLNEPEPVQTEPSAMQTELAAANQTLQDQKTPVNRYNWIAKAWRERGDDALLNLTIDKKSLSPSKELIGFLGLDRTQARKVESLSGKTLSLLTKWEKKNTIVLRQSETTCTYQIPRAPDDYLHQYLQALEKIVGETDMNLLQGAIRDGVERGLGERVISLSIIPANQNVSLFGSTERSTERTDKLSVSIQYIQQDDLHNITKSNVTPCGDAHRFPERWRHIGSF